MNVQVQGTPILRFNPRTKFKLWLNLIHVYEFRPKNLIELGMVVEEKKKENKKKKENIFSIGVAHSLFNVEDIPVSV